MVPPHLPRGQRRGTLVFLCVEDWFFRSHFLPMARAAQDLALDVVVATRVGAAAADLEAAGLRVLPLPGRRNAVGPQSLLRLGAQVRAILRSEQPCLIHGIGLPLSLLGGYASQGIGSVRGRLYAITGLGLLGAADGLGGWLARTGVRAALAPLLADRTARLLVENPEDATTVGWPDPARTLLLGGAGVDPTLFTPQPEPPSPPLVVTQVSRMLWSKGPDLAVAAVQQLRARGLDVVLRLVGDGDPENPRCIPPATLAQWAATPGVQWLGRRTDIPDLLAQSHLALLPSRGGEGLPRSLIEAAACGRACITTDVPGCRRIVRHGETGLVVPPNDPGALADAIAALAPDAAGRRRLGAAGRDLVLSAFTEAAVAGAVQDAYRALLDGAHP